MSQDQHSEQKAPFTSLYRLVTSRPLTGIGMFLSKYAPPPVGYATGGLIAGLINWLKPDVYGIVYANLRQVVGPQATEKTLHRLVRQVFHNTARNAYELWHLVGRGQAAIRAAIRFPPAAWAHLEQAQRRGKGILIVGPHTGNFHLGILALAAYGLDIQVLGLASAPGGGFDMMDQMLTRAGVRVTSASVQALREVLKHLRSGGIVLTGADRPVDGTEPSVEFFGRPAPLPTGHVRLALKTDATILLTSPHRDAQKRNVAGLSPPLEMVRTGDPDEDLRVNLQRVTTQLEELIRIQPGQWAMFLPVWPEGQSGQASS
jgi:lauroyl/myristoyl acyltransferase